MRIRATLICLVLAAAGCVGSTPPPTSDPPPPSISPSPALDGVEGFVRDLTAAEAPAREAGAFDGTPLAPQAVVVCVGLQDLRVYSYASAEERAAAARRIDPNDPSNIGTSIVDWAGEPKFWQRDRILVLYLGRDQPTIDLLVSVLGQPFARGAGRPPLRGPDSC